ncbi:MAG TPA: alpha-ketoglutarate-dependent dioxygenase AlkB [Ohtaekwangia sp.]|nr:alpha-ketoglutarate-dependent dioxygenase AlkB [Ohtaekwangia sp.]
MNTLFPVKPLFPDGFEYNPDFLSQKEQDDLLQEITKYERHTFKFQGYEAKRKVASFGYDYSFEKNILSMGLPIPPSFDSLLEKVSNHLGIDKHDFAELLITEYPVSAVINWHRDAFPFDLIAGISLGTDCLFRLRPYDKTKQGRGSIISVPVRAGSLYIMKGAARINWQHSIAPVKHIRYSITLRTLRKGS